MEVIIEDDDESKYDQDSLKVSRKSSNLIRLDKYNINKSKNSMIIFNKNNSQNYEVNNNRSLINETTYDKNKDFLSLSANNINNIDLNGDSSSNNKIKIYGLENHNVNSVNSNLIEDLNNNLNPNYNNNYTNKGKKNFFLDELYRKKNIILPFNKEINNINININGYNSPGGSLTSRTSNNASKKKCKRNHGIQEINLYNYKKMNSKNKMNKKNNSNLMPRNEGNPVKIKKAYDSIKKSKNIGNKNNAYLSVRKK